MHAVIANSNGRLDGVAPQHDNARAFRRERPKTFLSDQTKAYGRLP